MKKNILNIRKFGIFVLPLFLAACVKAPVRQPISVGNRKAIKSDDLVVNTTQNKIGLHKNNWFSHDLSDLYAPIDSGSIVEHHQDVGTGGLLRDLIVSGIEKHRDKSIKPFQKELQGFSFVNKFNSTLKEKFYSISWLKVKKSSLLHDIKKSEKRIVNTAKENTSLFVGTTYLLNSNFNQLEVAAYVKLDLKQPSGKPPKTLYMKNFFYIYRLEKKNGSKQKNQLVWLNNSAHFLKSKLIDASKNLAQVIVKDIQNPANTAIPPIGHSVQARRLSGVKFYGKILSVKNGHYEVRSPKGMIYILNKNSIIKFVG